jgi:hypothetical protein
MDSQIIGLEGVKEDIKEIKASLKELTTIAQNQAVQNQRMDSLEVRVVKIEKDVSESWKAIRKIDLRCVEREPVVKFGHRLMESPHHSPDDWWTMFLGSAIRNGLWIIMTGVMTTLILHYLGVKK